jgi:hypothetical protein
MYAAIIGYILGILTRIKNQPNPKPSERNTEQQNPSSQSSPIIITYSPPPPTDEEIAEKKYRERRDKTKYRIEKWGLFVLSIYTAFTGFMAWQMKESTKAAARAANAAQKQLEMSERPWITVALSVNGPLQFDSRGWATVHVQSVMKNVGHSVATHITLYPSIDMGTEHLLKIIGKQSYNCEFMRNNIDNSGVNVITLFPEESHIDNFAFQLTKEDIDKAARGPDNNLTRIAIYGCADYGMAFTSENHQTGFYYELERINPKGDIYGSGGRLIVPAMVIGEDVPASGLQIRRSSDGGFFVN